MHTPCLLSVGMKFVHSFVVAAASVVAFVCAPFIWVNLEAHINTLKLITLVRGKRALLNARWCGCFSHPNELSPPSQVHAKGYWQAFKDLPHPK